MKIIAPNATTPAPSATTDRDERIKHLPPAARAVFDQFQKDGNAAALDPVIFAILEDFIPKPPARPISEMPEDTELIAGLGFDSLAITEVVFFTEDLFGITITNDEVLEVKTLGDLRRFVQRKVSARTTT